MARGGYHFVIANQFPSGRGLHALPWPCLGLRILPTHAGMRRSESRARRVEETHLPCDILIFKLKSRAMGGVEVSCRSSCLSETPAHLAVSLPPLCFRLSHSHPQDSGNALHTMTCLRLSLSCPSVLFPVRL